jgi:hypothetical protein
MMFRWLSEPHWVRRSGLTYDSTQDYHHRDIMDRETKGQKDCRYISTNDGKIRTLVVQCIDDILSGPGNGTWKRTYIRNVSPIFYRLAMWPLSHVDMREGTLETTGDWALVIAKWIPACLLLTIGVSLQRILLAMFNTEILNRYSLFHRLLNTYVITAMNPSITNIGATQR